MMITGRARANPMTPPFSHQGIPNKFRVQDDEWQDEVENKGLKQWKTIQLHFYHRQYINGTRDNSDQTSQ